LRERAIIIGAGPAGLTAGLELLRRTGIQPILLEASDEIGGISRTIRYKGNRMDIGGHRFFSKSDRVMQWWTDLMPPEIAEDVAEATVEVSYQGKKRVVHVPARLEEEPPLRGMGPKEDISPDAEDEEEEEETPHSIETVVTVPVDATPDPDLVRPSRIWA
jgi:protoporphyrinogen oxidase